MTQVIGEQVINGGVGKLIMIFSITVRLNTVIMVVMCVHL